MSIPVKFNGSKFTGAADAEDLRIASYELAYRAGQETAAAFYHERRRFYSLSDRLLEVAKNISPAFPYGEVNTPGIVALQGARTELMHLSVRFGPRRGRK
jgi:hypothetical protein